MDKALDRVPRGAKVGVVRLRSLGDCVLTTPAIELLKRYRPDLQIAVVVEGRFAPVFEGNPDVSRILSPHLAPLLSWRPTLCLNLHGGTRSLILTEFSSAPITAGFGHYRWSWAYSSRISRAQEILGEDRTVHTAEHLASAMFYLGVPMTEIPRARLFETKAEVSVPRNPYAVIHPVASTPGKTWPAAGFVEVARQLQTMGIESVFIGGPGDKLGSFREFRTVCGAPLAETKTLLNHAAMFIGNDSGPAHMAAAFGKPLVTIFGDSDAVVWAPWKANSRQIVADGPIGSVTSRQVLDAVEQLGVKA
jgi:ADP-heptose:LPS heptosyltransferase